MDLNICTPHRCYTVQSGKLSCTVFSWWLRLISEVLAGGLGQVASGPLGLFHRAWLTFAGLFMVLRFVMALSCHWLHRIIPGSPLCWLSDVLVLSTGGQHPHFPFMFFSWLDELIKQVFDPRGVLTSLNEQINTCRGNLLSDITPSLISHAQFLFLGAVLPVGVEYSVFYNQLIWTELKPTSK